MSTQLQVVELETQALTWPEKARAVKIVDQQSYTTGAEMLVGIKTLRKEIDATFDPAIEKAHQAHKAILASKRRVEEPLVTAERLLKDGIATFEHQQRELQRQAEAKARLESERLAQEERLRNAVAAEEMGAAPELVDEILEQPVMVAAPVVAPTYQRAAGVSSRESFSADVVNFNQLLVAVMQGKADISCIQPNMQVLNALARAQKRLFAVPGCRVVVSGVVSSRAR